jgi:hypothetical protein
MKDIPAFIRDCQFVPVVPATPTSPTPKKVCGDFKNTFN